MIRPDLLSEADLALLEARAANLETRPLTPLEASLVEQVRWYREVFRKMEWCMANASGIEDAWAKWEELELSL